MTDSSWWLDVRVGSFISPAGDSLPSFILDEKREEFVRWVDDLRTGEVGLVLTVVDRRVTGVPDRVRDVEVLTSDGRTMWVVCDPSRKVIVEEAS